MISELDFAVEALEKVDDERGDGMKYSDACCAITGTNGKSTVTTFVGQLLSANHSSPLVGGNLVSPVSTPCVISSCYIVPIRVSGSHKGLSLHLSGRCSRYSFSNSTW